MHRNIAESCGPACDFAGLVNPIGIPEVSTQGSQIAEQVSIPKERMKGLVPSHIHSAGDLAVIVKAIDFKYGRPANRAQIPHVPVRPQKWVLCRDTCDWIDDRIG